MCFIIVSVFSIYFLNYGILYLLAPMNIQIPLVSDVLIGVYYDFNQQWYSDIGQQIISVMIINAIFPPLEILMLALWQIFLRSYD